MAMQVKYVVLEEDSHDKLTASIAYRVRAKFEGMDAVSGDVVTDILEAEKQAGNVSTIDRLPGHKASRMRLRFAVCFVDSSVLLIMTTHNRILMELGWELPVPGTTH